MTSRRIGMSAAAVWPWPSGGHDRAGVFGPFSAALFGAAFSQAWWICY